MFSGDVLKGKRILVTGGGTGLGKEMSVGFAAHGAHVFICGRRQEVLDNAVGEIRKRSGGQADALVANVRDPDSIEKMMADIWSTGPLTGLVNNAGANFLAPTDRPKPCRRAATKRSGRRLWMDRFTQHRRAGNAGLPRVCPG